MSNGILVVSFSVPVELSTDRLNSAAAGYVSAARRDPDGKGLRIALARKLTLHSMQANERLFVDLLPDSWTGSPPPLPQEVVEDLARRAKEADRRQRQMRLLAQQKQMAVTRVHVANQPTFSRYVFELPQLVAVLAERNGEKFDLQFDAPVKFDLAEAKASLPAMIDRIDAVTGEQTTTIRFTFIGKVDLRSFREDNSYVLDVAQPAATQQRRSDDREPRPTDAAAATGGLPSVLAAPLTVPARGAGNTRRADPFPMPDTVPSTMTFDPATEIEAANRMSIRQAKPVATAAAARPHPAPITAMPVDAATVEQREAMARTSPPTPAPATAGAMAQAAPATAAAPSAAAVPAPPTTAPLVPAGSASPLTAPPAVTAGAASAGATASLKVEVRREGDGIKLVFPFAVSTAGAVFRRADTLWAVFDSGDSDRCFRLADRRDPHNRRRFRLKLPRFPAHPPQARAASPHLDQRRYRMDNRDRRYRVRSHAADRDHPQRRERRTVDGGGAVRAAAIGPPPGRPRCRGCAVRRHRVSAAAWDAQGAGLRRVPGAGHNARACDRAICRRSRRRSRW